MTSPHPAPRSRKKVVRDFDWERLQDEWPSGKTFLVTILIGIFAGIFWECGFEGLVIAILTTFILINGLCTESVLNPYINARLTLPTIKSTKRRRKV